MNRENIATFSPRPACGERSDHARQRVIRVSGTLDELSASREPLTPTLSPQAGRGRPAAAPNTRRQAAVAAFALTGGAARNEIAILFQALMVAISMVRLTVSASENCARTSL